MYKIIFIDIDGTLRNNKKEISQRCKNLMKIYIVYIQKML